MSDTLLYCTNAFLLSLILIPVGAKIAIRVGLVDVPSSIKTHEGQIPMVGTALFAAFLVAVLLLRPEPPRLADLMLGAGAIVIVGAIDDLFDLRPVTKLALQCICVAITVCPHDLLIRDLGLPVTAPAALPHLLAAPLTVFAVVGFINAMNMIDGLDGLAGSVCLVALAWFGVAAAMLGLPAETLLVLVLGCIVLGFLVFNFRHAWRPRAAVFLGDAGSMMLGLSLAFIAIDLSQQPVMQLSPIAVLWIFALPTIDTLSLLVRRAISGKGALSSDREHFHDLLHNAGLGVTATVLLMAGISAVLGGVGIAGWLLGVPNEIMLLGLVAPTLLHTWFVLDGHKRQFRLPAAAGNRVPSPVRVQMVGVRPQQHPAVGGAQR
jgi:UDP-GlcNAc:undecaprenyl-phosphate GlcNAc-1-phosphate transferase